MITSTDRRLLTRIAIRNYKSIGACDVEPGQLSFLVGPNGSGKSNFLDALRFVGDSLRSSLDHALRERGGVQEVRRRSGGHPNHFGIRLEFRLPGAVGDYAFEVAAAPRGRFMIKREECRVVPDNAPLSEGHWYRLDRNDSGGGGQLSSSIGLLPAPASDRLFLVTASGREEFRPLYDALSAMGFYSLNPDSIRELQAPDPGDLLKRDGGNLASVVARLDAESPGAKARIEEYLAKVVPGTSAIGVKMIGPMQTLEFRQEVSGANTPWRFLANNMSDGTLRAAGLLVALFQANGLPGPRLVGIEEPEIALHPAAAGVLTDALVDASAQSQILVTSHSPDLLDDESVADQTILAVLAERGETRIGPLDDAGRSTLRDGLYTAGELLRMDQLRPDPDLSRPRQIALFGGLIER